jgi:Ca2+-transporting ATPase
MMTAAPTPHAPCAPGADTGAGLTEAEATRRLATQGPNELPTARPLGALRLLVDIATEPMFALLLACGSVYLVLGSRHEALMLLGFVLVIMAITWFQQRRAERSLSALRQLSSPRARVIRDGVARRIAGRDLVCGDLVLLAEGDRVPADLQLLVANDLWADESLLTGESAPVQKTLARPRPEASSPDAPAGRTPVPADLGPIATDKAGDRRTDIVLAGTLVVRGTARARAIATGENSALGQIGQSMRQIIPERTPTQRETDRLVRAVALSGLGLALLLAIIQGLAQGDWLHGLLAGLTLAMAVLPEELPVALTLFLALGAWRLAREQVLTRSMPTLELLGGATVLCVDKTGTLTRNQMSVERLWCPTAEARDLVDARQVLAEDLHPVLEHAVLASHRQAHDPMEVAIRQAGDRLLVDTGHLHADWTLIEDYPLTSELLAMSRVWQSADRRAWMIASKGAPEAIADLCHLSPERSGRVAAQAAAMASDGLRVLGVARSRHEAGALPARQHDLDFEFVGLIGLQDPLRPGVEAAIAQCRSAGIRVVMLTGDHPVTALAIARQAGLPSGTLAMTGAELSGLDERALEGRLDNTLVFCRLQPEHKLRLVRAFKARGDIVAMTGDGVNDAPALRAAHIGVAMGLRGTDVAREAAALVLLDDEFGSIVGAIRTGRRIFTNLRKAIGFLIAVHIPIAGLSLLPILPGWPMLLMPVHVLLLELIIDPACTLVFEAEPIDQATQSARPRPVDEPLFDRGTLLRALLQGSGLLVILLAGSVLGRMNGLSDEAVRTLAVSALVLSSLGLIQVTRVGTGPVFAIDRGLNLPFLLIGLTGLLLLVIALQVPAVRALFAFEAPTMPLVGASLGLAALSTAWFTLARGVASIIASHTR